MESGEWTHGLGVALLCQRVYTRCELVFYSATSQKVQQALSPMVVTYTFHSLLRTAYSGQSSLPLHSHSHCLLRAPSPLQSRPLPLSTQLGSGYFSSETPLFFTVPTVLSSRALGKQESLWIWTLNTVF